MADIVSPEVRSRMMARIKGRDTRAEVLLRKALHARGLRFRLNVRSLPGSPDIVLPRYRAAILVHGCYWHRHKGCPKTTTPSTNVEFWQKKFQANVERDRRILRELLEAGWRVAVVWECIVRNPVSNDLCDELEAFIRGNSSFIELPSVDS